MLVVISYIPKSDWTMFHGNTGVNTNLLKLQLKLQDLTKEISLQRKILCGISGLLKVYYKITGSLKDASPYINFR